TNLKRMKFRENFGAEDAARLTPCKDDKPKYTGIPPFKAWFGCLLSPYPDRNYPNLIFCGVLNPVGVLQKTKVLYRKKAVT
ncbi:MAG: hypothetical protein IJN25_10085, partial [Clostridia bacterium]|nr:hypothetical protein [Clostridia bacterium]